VYVYTSVCLPKTYWGSGSIAPRILVLGIRWRWVVSFTPRPLYPQGKSPWYSLDRRLGGPHNRSGRGGEEKNSQPPPGIEPQIVQPVAQRYTNWAITALVCCVLLLINCKASFLEIHVGHVVVLWSVYNTFVTAYWPYVIQGLVTYSGTQVHCLLGEFASWLLVSVKNIKGLLCRQTLLGRVVFHLPLPKPVS
jgi:hypothetical protein